jgi:outer membrane protein assembly factor BamD
VLPLDAHAARNKVGLSAGRDSDHLMTLRLRGSEKSGHRLRALAGWLALALVVAPLMGCSLFNKDDDLIPDTPADKLYNEGLFLLNNRQEYKEAAKKFDEVDRQNPYSDWARKALLMSAYSYYQAKEYTDCISSAQRYVTLHPGSPDAAYAQYLIGSSYYDQILDVSRDQARADKAINSLEEVVRKYPAAST